MNICRASYATATTIETVAKFYGVEVENVRRVLPTPAPWVSVYDVSLPERPSTRDAWPADYFHSPPHEKEWQCEDCGELIPGGTHNCMQWGEGDRWDED